MPIIKGLDKLIKYNDRSIKDLTTTPAAAGGGGTGALVHIKTLTASSSATLDFLNGSSDVVFDDTYPIYKFEFINCHPATDGVNFSFQADTGTNTSYNQTITSTNFSAYHGENGNSGTLSYSTGGDKAQATTFQNLNSTSEIGNNNDQSISGELTIYNPSNTTFVKHFMSNTNWNELYDFTGNTYVAGYFNTTTALTRVQFKMSSGNIDAGKIKLFGILDS
jgi:hypothetical protein